MKFIVGSLFSLCVALASVHATPPQIHVHLLGPDAIRKHPDAGGLKDIIKLDDSKTVGGFLLGRLTTLIAGDFAGTSTNEAVVKLATLLQRGLANEFVVEVTDLESGGWRAAFLLPGAEKNHFNGALKAFGQKRGGKVSFPLDAHGSWLLTAKGAKRSVHVSTHGDWVMVDASGSAQPSDWRKATAKNHRPVPDLAGLARIRCASESLPLLGPGLRLPRSFSVDLKISFHNERLRTEGNIDFEESVKLPLEPFNIPAQSLRDPLISFSALRGFRNWLKTWRELPQWRLPAIPNQAFFWAQQDLPMHSLAAFPFPNVAKYLKQQDARVKETLNPDLAKRGIGQFAYDPQSGGQVLRDLMLMAPFMAPAPEPSGNWALIGTVVGNRPTGANTNPPPAELLNQIRNRPNLIYYDWEITQPRLEQMTMLVSFIRVVAMRFATSGGNPFPSWLMSIRPFLGNTVTEVRRESDRRWSIERTSDVGLTALELNLLSQRFAPIVRLPVLPAVPGN